MKNLNKYIFPFAAVLGQEYVKKALLICAVNPKTGGVLISGEKGTAKSTLVRGLEDIIENLKVIDVPLSTTEDRLIGSIDIEKSISSGTKSFEEGILKKADGNVLYIDEVNLLSENIVNSIIEVSSLGINIIEREGISFTHKSEFVLVGTMNPEEGLLRPQFVDRFGLYVEAKGSKKIDERKEIIKRRIEYENNPVSYINKWKKETDKLKEIVFKAKKLINKVKINEKQISFAASIANEGNCQGHRAEIVIIEASKALAVLDGRIFVDSEDIKIASKMALPHRIRNKNTEPSETKDKPQDNFNNNTPKDNESKDNNHKDTKELQNKEIKDNCDICKEEICIEKLNNTQHKKTMQNFECKDAVDEGEKIFNIKPINIQKMDRQKRSGSGKRTKTKTNSQTGRYIKYKFCRDRINDIAFDATLRAASIHQKFRKKENIAIEIHKEDLREKVREKRTGNTILFVVDASGSMAAKKRMKLVKEVILSILNDAYQKRDKVGLIAFRKNCAEQLLGFTRSVDLAQKQLQKMPTGGKTPLAKGLSKGYETIKLAKLKDNDILPLLVLVSDGRANVSLKSEKDPFKDAISIANKIYNEKIPALVIDTEKGYINLGLAKQLAQNLGALYYKLEDFCADEIKQAIKITKESGVI